MSVSAVEIQSGAIAAGGSATVTIATTLVPADRVVVYQVKTGTTGTPAVSGLGTWVAAESLSTTRDSAIHTATGITGGGNITVTPGSLAADYVVLVLRSSIGASVTIHDTDSAAYGSATTMTSADISGSVANMFVCMCVTMNSATLTFPSSSVLPLSGWSTAYTGSNVNSKWIYQTLSASSTVHAAASASGSTTWTSLVGVFTDGDTGGTPLTSTFVGWGNPIF